MARASGSKRERSREAARETVAQAGALAEAPAERPRARHQDPFTGGLRRREVLPLLVLHFISEGPSYGNQLMERIAELESRGLIEGKWEHPERRSRRYYSVTGAGTEEYERLVGEVRPFLDSARASIEAIVAEVYE
jgi:PadR family transcriptional regulator PadR